MNETKTVLVVDDDPDVVRGLSARLKATGYQTIVANDGEGGVAAAVSEQPDAIVLDVQLPAMDGIEALDELRANEDTRNIPIVMLSASLSAQQAALDAGARFFLPKPYQGSALVEAIGAAITEKDNEELETNREERANDG